MRKKLVTSLLILSCVLSSSVPAYANDISIGAGEHQSVNITSNASIPIQPEDDDDDTTTTPDPDTGNTPTGGDTGDNTGDNTGGNSSGSGTQAPDTPTGTPDTPTGGDNSGGTDDSGTPDPDNPDSGTPDPDNPTGEDGGTPSGLVVTLPANMDLALNKQTKQYEIHSKIKAKGNLPSNCVLWVSTCPTIEYVNKENSDVSFMASTDDFKTAVDGMIFWQGSELSADSPVEKNFSFVKGGTDDAVGDFDTTVTFNLGCEIVQSVESLEAETGISYTLEPLSTEAPSTVATIYNEDNAASQEAANKINGVADFPAFIYKDGVNYQVTEYKLSNELNASAFGLANFSELHYPEGITTTHNITGSENSSCTKVSLPSTLTSIEAHSFDDFSNLNDVTLPDSVKYIGEYAFANISGSMNLDIPNSVETIGDYAFANSNISSITLPNSATYGSGVFNNCTINTVNIPNIWTEIPSNLFTAQGIQTLNLPVSIKTIAANSFTLVDRPYVINYAGTKEQFQSIEGLNNLVLSTTVHCIDGDLKYVYGVLQIPQAPITKTTSFDMTQSYVDDYVTDEVLTIPSVMNLEDGTPARVTSIQGDSSNNQGTDITSVVIPDSVTSLGWSAFRGFTDLASITIPDSVATIGSSAFQDCSSLASITIPDKVTSIEDNAFYNCSSLTNITIPNSVTSISYNAFASCKSLTSIVIPDKVTSIGDCVFQDCSSLASITIPDKVTSIGNCAFQNCSSLTNITISNISKLKTIGISTFNNCYSLTSITIPDKVTSIGDSAFKDCSSLASITIPSSVTSIGSFAFQNCSSLTSVAIPAGVFLIENITFSGCSSLASITIPDTIKKIGSSAFYNCTALSTVNYSGITDQFKAITGLTNLTDKAYNSGDLQVICSDTTLRYISQITSFDMTQAYVDDYVSDGVLTIPSIMTLDNGKAARVTSIRGNFSDNRGTGITSVTIPSSVTSIGSSAFKDFTDLASITIPDTIKKIGYNAFYNCTALSTVNYSGTTDQFKAITDLSYLTYRGYNSGDLQVICSDGTLHYVSGKLQ